MLDHLNEVREELWKSVTGLSDEELNMKMAEDEWTIAQVLEHLYLVERAVASQLKHGLYEESEEPFEEKPIHLALDRSIKAKVPISALEPKSEPQTFVSLRSKLDKSRQQLTEAATELDPAILTHRALSHPAFGLINLKQWVESVGIHEQRHIEQIKELKAKLSRV